jgi:hypothetical protein
MDAIDNKITSSPSVGAANDEDLVSTSAAASEDLDSQVAAKEIEKLQQDQQLERALDARLPPASPDSGTEWDPWKIMVIRHQ